MGKFLSSILTHPRWIFFVCLAVVALSVLVDGTAIHLWKLKNKEVELESRIQTLKIESKQLQGDIKRAFDPKYLERRARDQFDLVEEGDLVFVFTD